MTDAAGTRQWGMLFDEVAEAYDSRRPSYPDELLEAVCADAGVRAGDRVLEIGCGTGQLTASLVARGLRVVAVDPGPRMIERARRRMSSRAVEFVSGRFEDVALAANAYRAVFSAAAFHWLDPAVSWAKAASLLARNGSLVLLGHCSGADADSIEIEQALFDSLERIAPEIATTLPRPREARHVITGAECRQGNVSELWSWIQHSDLATPEAAGLYQDVRLVAQPERSDWTAERLNALMRTTSVSFRLGPERTAALEADTYKVLDRFGGRVQLPGLVVAVSARRAETSTSE